MRCTACEKEYTKKEIMFTEDRLPYCINPFTCNDAHPNSVAKIVERGGAVNMYTEEELKSNTFEKLDVSPEMKERIMKIATKPQSIRLSSLDIAHYLLAIQESKELSSISEAVRHCVAVAMRVEPIDAAMEELPVPEKEQPSAVQVKKEESGIKIVVGNSEPEPEQVPDEDFTF